MSKKKGADLVCSFCGKSQDEAKKLIAGPEVYICDECIALCADIIEEELSEEVASEEDINLLPPAELHAKLNDYVIGQEFAKKVLSVAVCNHYKRLMHLNQQEENDVELTKSNILLVGPTGSGKTLLAQTMAKILNVPFAMADATTLTEAGYVGEDVENIVQKLLQSCDYDIEKAQRGIIYVDEIDKIVRKTENASLTRDVSGEGVQQALLKIIEGTVAAIPPQGGRKHPQQEYLHVDTSNILFICGGAFADLDKLVKERTSKSSIGFGAAVKSGDDFSTQELMKMLQPEDLIKYGLIPEFVGRLPVTAVLDELDEAALVQILTQPKNALLKQYKKLFEFDGAELEFEEGTMELIAEKAIKRKTGARGLRSILEHALLDTMYELPGIENIVKVIVNKEVIAGREKPVYRMEKKQANVSSVDKKTKKTAITESLEVEKKKKEG